MACIKESCHAQKWSGLNSFFTAQWKLCMAAGTFHCCNDPSYEKWGKSIVHIYRLNFPINKQYDILWYKMCQMFCLIMINRRHPFINIILWLARKLRLTVSMITPNASVSRSMQKLINCLHVLWIILNRIWPIFNQYFTKGSYKIYLAIWTIIWYPL